MRPHNSDRLATYVSLCSRASLGDFAFDRAGGRTFQVRPSIAERSTWKLTSPRLSSGVEAELEKFGPSRNFAGSDSPGGAAPHTFFRTEIGRLSQRGEGQAIVSDYVFGSASLRGDIDGRAAREPNGVERDKPYVATKRFAVGCGDRDLDRERLRSAC